MKMNFGGSEMSFSDWKMSFLVFKAVAKEVKVTFLSFILTSLNLPKAFQI